MQVLLQSEVKLSVLHSVFSETELLARCGINTGDGAIAPVKEQPEAAGVLHEPLPAHASKLIQ